MEGLVKIRILLFSALVFLPAKVWCENNCVTCHEKLVPSPARAHSFQEWKDSVHSRKGIGCEKCHGGDPSETDRQKAHRPVLRSSEKESPVYFTRIPESCGSCHADEFSEFRKSYHYKELRRTGRGPNCVTCHGSMATHLLETKQMEETCSLCHAEPRSAGEALAAMNLAASALKEWEKNFEKARAQGGTTSADESLLKRQKTAFREVQKKWHAFSMGEVIRQAREIAEISKKEAQGLRLKGVR
jgi:hypothetical protein